MDAQPIELEGLGPLKVTSGSRLLFETTPASNYTNTINFFSHLGDLGSLEGLFGPYKDDIIRVDEGMSVSSLVLFDITLTDSVSGDFGDRLVYTGERPRHGEILLKHAQKCNDILQHLREQAETTNMPVAFAIYN